MGRTMTKNSSSTASMPKTGPAVATRRRPVITPSRSSNSSGASSEQRHVVSSRVTATPKPSVAVVLAALTVGNVTASKDPRLRSSHPRPPRRRINSRQTTAQIGLANPLRTCFTRVGTNPAMMFFMQAAAAPSSGPIPADLPPALCILGLGLIGSSLARAMHDRLPVVGWSPSEETRAAAAADGFDVADTLDSALRRAVQQDALVVLASPVTTFRGLLGSIDELAPKVRLTDVASVKAVVQDQVANLAPQARYIGSHPMAGTANSGWPAGSPGLFDGAAWVTCLTEDSNADDWAAVASVALAVGSRVVPAEPPAHDAAVARISHLPHILALALAQVGEQGGALALSLA